MKQSHEFRGDGPDLGFTFSGGQYFPKVMRIPLLFQVDRLVTAHLVNSLGNTSLVGNYSVASPGIFEFITPNNAFFAIATFTLVLVDTGITPLLFGGLPALSNGMTITVVDENNVQKYNLHAGSPIKQNYEFAHIAGASYLLEQGGAADQITLNWESAVLGLYPTMRPGWKFRVTIQDNLTGIDKLEASIGGAYISGDTVLIA